MNQECWYRFIRTLSWGLFRFFYDARNEGLENVPDGGCILASNHVSFFDPPLVGCQFDDPTYYLARKTLFDHWLFGPYIRSINALPVDQDRPDMAGLKRIVTTLRAGRRLVLFPEGSRAWDGTLQPAEPGVGFLVAKADVPVVPVRVFGPYEAWPRGGRLRIFVPMRVVYGKPVRYSVPKGATKEDYRKIGQDIMAKIAELS
jgi:1-acyl-sn-glycerol-3-phosphate acyltransferase